MLTFYFRKTRITVRFSFVCLAAVCLLLYNEQTVYFGLGSALLHELGHLAAMKLSRVSVNEICFHGGGIAIKPRLTPKTPVQELLILSAGAAVNLTLCLIFFRFKTLFYINLSLALFNLLPIGELDGAGILEVLTRGRPKTGTAAKIIISAALAALAVTLALLGGNSKSVVTALFLCVMTTLSIRL